MLRQLFMTLSFYEVTAPSFNYSTTSLPSLFTAPSTPINIVLMRLAKSRFYLCPYIVPTVRQPPMGIYSSRFAAFDYLQKLSDTDKQLFLKAYQRYRHPKSATKNPTAQTNAYWQWIIRFNLSPWDIRKLIIDKTIDHLAVDHLAANPDLNPKRDPWWSQQRAGQSQTLLSDGRTIHIGGEYEDYYDPDFCIYNDVIVRHPDGRIESYGYPRASFPPTDFHTATLVGDYIYIIGSIGYIDERRYSHTPVYRLNIHTLKIDEVATRNSIGWIYKHKAKLRDNQIIITGGQYIADANSPILDNIDTWALTLNTLIWKNITHRNRHWQRFYITKCDAGDLNLADYRRLIDCKNDNRAQRAELYALKISDNIGCAPDEVSYRQLLVPPIAHDVPSDWDNENELVDYDKVIFIDDIKVGYKINADCIDVMIEGRLSVDITELLQQNLRHKLSKVENMACDVTVL